MIDLQKVIGLLDKMYLGTNTEMKAAQAEWSQIECEQPPLADTMRTLRAVYMTGVARGMASVMVGAKDRCDLFERRVKALDPSIVIAR